MTLVAEGRLTSLARAARVGELLPDALLPGGPLRRMDAAALLLPGEQDLRRYLAALDGAAHEFAIWSGRIVTLRPDGERLHRVLIVDRYGQVYDVVETADERSLPGAGDLTQWFRFLATACPECGVIDDPLPRAYVP